MTTRFFAPMLTAALVAALSACASGNPYESEVKQGIDTAEVAPDERPTPDEVKNTRAAIAVLPVLDNSGRVPASLPAELFNRLSAAIGERCNAHVVSGEATVKRLVEQQKRAASSLYDPNGAAEIGKLLSAGYVAALTIDSALTNSESTTVQTKDGYVTHWDAEARIAVTLAIISVETGEYVFQKRAEEEQSDSLMSTQPGETWFNMALRAAGAESVSSVTVGMGACFPVAGYITQSRGEHSWVLINLGEKDGISPNMGFYVYRIRTARDPVTGQMQRQHIRVGEIATDQPDSLGFWCQTIDGEKNLRVGMLVKSNGRVRVEGLFGAEMRGD